MRLRKLLMLAACVVQAACAKVTTPYPDSWQRTQPLKACNAVAGTWSDAGAYVGHKGRKPKSLAQMLHMLSLMKTSGSGSLADPPLSVRTVTFSSPRADQLQVSAALAAGGTQRKETFRCTVHEGWAQLSEWQLDRIANHGWGGPGVNTSQETLAFRRNAAGELIARWSSRDRHYLLFIPFDEDYLRWLRFKPAGAP